MLTQSTAVGTFGHRGPHVIARAASGVWSALAHAQIRLRHLAETPAWEAQLNHSIARLRHVKVYCRENYFS